MKMRSRVGRLWLVSVLALIASIGVLAVASAAPPPAAKRASVRQAATITVPANTWTYFGNDGEQLGVLLLKVGHIALVGQCGYGFDTSTQTNALVMKFVYEAVGAPVVFVTPSGEVLPPGGQWSGGGSAFLGGPNRLYLSPGTTGDGSYGNPTDRSADVVIVHGPTENASGFGTFAVMDAKGASFTATWGALGDYNTQSCQFTVQAAG